MAAPTPIPSAIPLPRLEDYGGGDESPAKVTPRSVLPTNDYGQGSPTGGQKLGGNATDEAEVGRARQSPGKSRLDGVASLVLPVASTVEAVGKSVAAGQKDEERIISPQIEEKVAETLGDSVDEPNRESVAKHSLIGVRSRLGESGSAAAATMESDVSQAPSDVNPAAAEQDKPTTGGAGTQVISEAAPAVVGGLNPGSAGRPGELQGKAGKRKKGTAAGDPSAPRSPKPVSKWLRGVFFWGSKSPGTRTPLPDTEPPREVTSTGQGGAAGDFSDGQSRFGGFPASTPIERQKTGLSSVSGDADRNLEAASPPVGPSLGSFARPPTSIESAQKGSATEPAEDNRGSEDNRGFEDKRGSPSESRSPATGSKLLGVESAPQPFPPTSEPAVGFTMFENPLTTTQTSVEITSPDRSRSTIDSGDVSSSGDSVPLFRWPVGKLATPPSRGPKGSVENAFDDDSASGGSLSGFTGGGGKGAPQNALEDDSTATSGGPRVAALAGGENWRLQAPGSPNSARTIKALRGSLPPLDLGAGAQEDVPSPKPQGQCLDVRVSEKQSQDFLALIEPGPSL